MAIYDPYYYGKTRGTMRLDVLEGSEVGGFYVDWSIETMSEVDNKSYIDFYIRADSNVPDSEITANGATQVDFRINERYTKTVHFRSNKDVEHYGEWLSYDEFGQLYMKLTLTCYSYGSENYRDSVEETFAVKGFPREAVLHSAPSSFTDEDNPTITYESAVTGARAFISTNTNQEELDAIVIHNLEMSYDTESSYTFELTEEERDALRLRCRNAKNMTLYFGVVGEVAYTFHETNFSVINANPTARGTVKDINPVTLALTGDESTLIRFASTAEVKAQYTAYKQATLAGYWIEHNSNIFPETTHVFEKVEGNIFGFYATDSRGYIGESYVQAPMIEYVRLTCNIDTSKKPDTEGVMHLKCSGNYFNDTFGYTDAAAANTLQVQYRYKLQNEEYSDWATQPHTINDDGTYEAEIFIDGLNYTSTYVFQCRAIDKLNDIQTVEYVVKSLPVFHWGENDFVFEVPVTFNAPTVGIEHPAPPPDYSLGGAMDGDLTITGDLSANGDLTIDGDLYLPGEVKTIYFDDERTTYISKDEDGALTIKSSSITLDGPINAPQATSIEFGTWTPELHEEAIWYETTNQGWYQKIGNVVTVGFFVKVRAYTGHSEKVFRIGGLPFTPVYTATGGGLCSGCYVSAGFNFQCWAADSSGSITGRVQACNETTAKDLVTSASGLFYPDDDNDNPEITASGTITYVTW